MFKTPPPPDTGFILQPNLLSSLILGHSYLYSYSYSLSPTLYSSVSVLISLSFEVLEFKFKALHQGIVS